MIKKFFLVLLCSFVILCNTSCASIGGTYLEIKNNHAPSPYIGTFIDVGVIDWGGQKGPALLEPAVIIAAVDLPMSLVMDTAIFPFVLPWWLFYKYTRHSTQGIYK